MCRDAPSTAVTAARDDAALAYQLLLDEYIHRSANDFAVACIEVQIAGRQITLEETRQRLETLLDRLNSLVSIQRLLQRPPGAAMDLSDQLGILCHHHAQARFAQQGAFVELRANEVSIDADRGWAVLMIVSELLTNAAKHAFVAGGGRVNIDIELRQAEIICVVSDDGVGLVHATAAGRTGSMIVAKLAKSAGIALKTYRRPNGTTVEMRLAALTG